MKTRCAIRRVLLPALWPGRCRSVSLLALPLLARVSPNLPSRDEGSAQRRPQAVASDLYPYSVAGDLVDLPHLAVWAGALLSYHSAEIERRDGRHSPAKHRCSMLRTTSQRPWFLRAILLTGLSGGTVQGVQIYARLDLHQSCRSRRTSASRVNVKLNVAHSSAFAQQVCP